jgi:DNA-binding transcriptional regulator YdaS (Cro superfamily)
MATGLIKAIEAAGSIRKLAGLLGVSHQAVSKWDNVPAHWIVEIERVTGVPREQLRPDLYRR